MCCLRIVAAGQGETLMGAVAQRSEIPVELTWDLSSLFQSDRAWEDAFAAVAARIPEIEGLHGTLGRSGRDLLQALVTRDGVSEQFERVYEFAARRRDEDLANSLYASMADRALGLGSDLEAAAAFFAPEILAIDPARLTALLSEDPGLAVYRHEIDEITAEREHVRSAEIEQVLAGAFELGHGPVQIYDAAHVLDRRLPTLLDESGHEMQLTDGAYIRCLRSTDRRVRREAFEGMLGSFQKLQHTFGATLANQVKKSRFFARAHRYDTCLEAALAGTHIPVQVYRTLVDTVRERMPGLNRYMALRRRVLTGGEPLHMYDLYAPLAPDVDLDMPYAEACKQVVEAFAPLGSDYTAVVARGLRSRWVDVMESKGKATGAYSSGVYGSEPFIMLNYQSRRDDLFTLAHELGHSLHTYLSNGAQPYHYARYPIFLAEIASTFNEALLHHYLLQRTGDRAARTAMLNQYVEGFRSTVIRQTLFAEFELRIHEVVEAGGALTVDVLKGTYRRLVEQYYGQAGVVVDDLIDWEWAAIPHFYMNFYVYQYATGFVASSALSQAVLRDGEPAVRRYLDMLRAGSSGYPVDLLKAAGVDMTSPAPILAAFDEFDRVVAELDSLL
jgi:oligoendopeptidase F